MTLYLYTPPCKIYAACIYNVSYKEGCGSAPEWNLAASFGELLLNLYVVLMYRRHHIPTFSLCGRATF
jgi:hypothetical protein